MRAVLAAGVSREQIEDALAVCFVFNTIGRLADPFEFFGPSFRGRREVLDGPRLKTMAVAAAVSASLLAPSSADPSYRSRLLAAYTVAAIWGVGSETIRLMGELPHGLAHGSVAQETFIKVLAYSSAPTGLIAFALMLWGLRIDDKRALYLQF
jgi:hypothetical protein